jgi:spermidine synthase
VPEVVEAARKYMTNIVFAKGEPPVDFTSGLFEDKRVEIVIDDGRHYLMASDEKFDMINADLFLPYKTGADSLYSREHFENVKARLNPGGVFVQWLPMYQLTEDEFGPIAKTMLAVFDQVTLWRNSFRPGQEVVALVGHRDATPLPECAVDTTEPRRQELAGIDPQEVSKLDLTYNEENALLFYGGNISAAREMFAGYPVNTDDRPVIEYISPFSLRKKVDGFVPTIVGPRYIEFIDELIRRCPPETDPVLARRSNVNRRLARAGAELHRFWVCRAVEDESGAADAWARFAREWCGD